MAYFEKRTDLAIEEKERFPQDNVELSGVKITKKQYEKEKITLTKVEITTAEGAMEMKKPIGNYITLEFPYNEVPIASFSKSERKKLIEKICKILKKMIAEVTKQNKNQVVLVTGLGNRLATPDALGPIVIENLQMNRHLVKSFPSNEKEQENCICGIAPGVMGQTGIETFEILDGIIKNIHPDCLLVIDALATRSIHRLCHTIQITDTGIAPGAGIGNTRMIINQETTGIPVIAIGVPTVVDAKIIIFEAINSQQH